MTYHYYTKDDYPDSDIIFMAKVRGLSIEQEFYRHKAYIFKCILFGKDSIHEEEWSERLREIGLIKFSLRKQLFWIIQVLLKKQ